MYFIFISYGLKQLVIRLNMEKVARSWPIKLKFLPIMLLSIAQRLKKVTHYAL